ncbi:MAG: hypothetical protein FJW30_23780 [Acidobacteria bacterium]|nr:hypothetical protein [Acidobacteriota bacterium]
MKTRIALFALLAASAAARKFYDDDPLIAEPKPLSIDKAASRKLSDYFDVFSHLLATPGELAAKKGKPIPAQAVNTLGEPMEGAWWVQRHYYKPMSLEELRKGPTRGLPPSAEGAWTVIGAKNEGITPGFVILDANKRRYFIKFDPLSNPEMATGADQISIKLFHALGYHVPDNYLAYFTEDRLVLGQDVEIADNLGNKRKMTRRDVSEILMKVPRGKDGRYRATASLAIAGKGIGPYRYYGQRTDDPNDTTPHEHRRDLRGLHVFCAWTAHDDSRAINTYDSLTEENGVKFVKHFLLDLGSTLGSASSKPNSPRSGGEYLFGWKLAAKNLLTLGLDVPAWARAKYSKLPAVGLFEGERFDPERWVAEYPNPAFLNRLPDDEFWAAKQVMAFSDAEIRAIVETAAFSDARATEDIATAMIQRRDRIGKAYFAKVLPLDGFSVASGELRFENLGARYKLGPEAGYSVKWHQFDNDTERLTPHPAQEFRVPVQNGYWMAEIGHPSRPKQTVRVFGRGDRVVGLERTW